MTAGPDRGDAERLAAVIARVPGWAGRARVVRSLSGGITNRNHVVDVDGDQYVVRLPGAETELLEIDRECERVAASRAGELGFAPPVLGLFDGCLVTGFVAGECPSPAALEDPGTLDEIAAMLRAFHGSAALPHTFDAFEVPGLHHAAAVARGVPSPSGYARMDAILRDIARAFARSADALVPSHNDLLLANFLLDGRRLWLLDWEYAGMNQPTFDLGNLAVNNSFSPEAEQHFVASYFGAPSERDAARVRLMKVVSDAREAMWGMVQQAISAIDFDYRAYTEERLDRLFGNAAAAWFAPSLRAAAEPATSR